MATQDELKQQVAKAAVEYVKGGIIGVGTGSTANFFIDELAKVKDRIDGAVASSEATAQRLRGHGIQVFDLNDVDGMEIYVDGADEITEQMHGMTQEGVMAMQFEDIVTQMMSRISQRTNNVGSYLHAFLRLQQDQSEKDGLKRFRTRCDSLVQLLVDSQVKAESIRGGNAAQHAMSKDDGDIELF